MLAKMEADGIDLDVTDSDHHLLIEPSERSLIAMLADFPEVVRNVGLLYDPSLLTRYSIDLATAFHKFYTDCRCHDAQEDIRKVRIALLLATKQTLANACGMLGISAPEKM
jgi:arginyl-tRNA synthetase